MSVSIFVYMCVCAPHACLVTTEARRVLDPLDLGLQIVVS